MRLIFNDPSFELSPAMPPAVPASKRNDISVKLDLSRPTKTIAEEERVSTRSIQQYQKNLLQHSHTYAARDVPQGRPRLFTPEMEMVTKKLKGMET